MELRFDTHEAEVLHRVLTNYLGDLRMEIAGTESYEFRQGLKEDEYVIKALLRALSQLGVTPVS